MDIIPSQNVDKTRWDKLVSENESVPYDYSFYLDAVAENWCLYVDSTYTKGVAFSTSKRLGIVNVTIPPFVRENRFYGNWNQQEMKDFMMILQHKFKGGIFQTNQPISSFQRSYQIVDECILSSHAKRNLKKAKKYGISTEISNEIQPAFELMAQELSNKIPDFDTKHQQILLKLFVALRQNNKLIIRNIIKDDKVLGGLFFFKGKQRTLYIKGGANEEGKHNGGMYLAMYEQISETLQRQLLFDFDGSEVPGVKRFNEYFGTVNVLYSQHKWNKNPLYYRIIRRIYLTLK